MSEGGGYDILVELDALFDVRMAALFRANHEAATKLLWDERYFKREADDFEEMSGIPRSVTDEILKNRDRSLLTADGTSSNVFMTMAIAQLDEIIKSIFYGEMVRGTPRNFQVVIMAGPYKLSQDEMDTIALYVRSTLSTKIPVICIANGLEHATPKTLKASCSGALIYNFNEWLTLHAKEINQISFPQVTIAVPRLYAGPMPKPDQRNVKEFGGASPFAIAKLGFATQFTLAFLHPTIFSIPAPLGLQHKLAAHAQDVAASEKDAVITPPTPPVPPEEFLRDSQETNRT
jgi:hypothetical protein